MSVLFIAIFPDDERAQDGVRAVKELASRSLLNLHGAATVTKNKNGKLSMHVVADEGAAVTTTGALIGGLSGLAIGPLAAAVLAVGGAVFGASAGLTNRGAGTALAERVAADLAADQVAIVVDVTTDDVSGLEARLKAVGAVVTRKDGV